MIQRQFHFIIISCSIGVLIACTSAPQKLTIAPERPIIPPIPEQIMGQSQLPASVLAEFLVNQNPAIALETGLELAQLYVEEAAREGIVAEIAFVQMCLETGFLRFEGLVRPDMNNFCGLGAISPEKPGEHFPNAQIGVRAHIQHLKGYASTDPLTQEPVDPRFRYIRRGSAPTIHDLSGRWAQDPLYGHKLEDLLKRLYEFAYQ